MPASHKSNGSTKVSTNITTASKWKASKIMTAGLSKKKQKGPTQESHRDMISLSSIETTGSIAKSASDELTIIPDGQTNTEDKEQTDTEESADAELSMLPLISTIPIEDVLMTAFSDRLKRDWNAPVYAFFQPISNVDHDNGWRFHEFMCAAKGCKKKIRCYLDMKDTKSTSNL
jgi:hypothetical protein